ncbi:hypothetical protein B0H12DRAFT_1224329 [Mycena haematopus]|nr:hypothetical protein B0H12DRAFT_1224329 [Mycena haematopus]
MPPFQVYEFAFACCSIAAVALLIWDWVITISAEVQRIWSRRLSGSTILYACLRYGTLCEKITVLVLASWSITPHSELLDTDSLRVLALSQKNWYLAIPVFLMCLPSAIAPAYVYAHQESPGVDIYGCLLIYTASNSAMVHRLRIGEVVADLLSETMVIVITVSRTFWLRKFRRDEIFSGERQQSGVALLLLRDGTVYFRALLLLSLTDMLVLTLDHVPEFATLYDYWVVPYFTPVFRTIIICRFLLMLRAVYYDDDDEENIDHPIHFASRIIGPLGAPVDATLFDEVRDEDEDEDEESVYAVDPFVAGLMVMSAPGSKGDDRVGLSSNLNSNLASQRERESGGV